jgi:hypothetical protein
MFRPKIPTYIANTRVRENATAPTSIVHSSLVPDSMIQWWDMLEAMYQSSAQMRDFAHEYRAVTHPQIEMLAARVAALNRCEY